MSTVDAQYIDSALELAALGGDGPFWRHLHWGLFDDPEVDDNSPERYYAAAEALTEHLLVAAGVADGRRILDVGCGFGGTLDYVAARNDGCQLAGINIDERQLQRGQVLLAEHGTGGSTHVPFVAADGCQLPVAAESLDHVLAVECVFHFPSRKQFFREAARVLRPGGTLALSDFLIGSGSPGNYIKAVQALGLEETGADWWGRQARPLTPAGYGKLGRGTGFDVLVDDDVTTPTFPTYAALRHLYVAKELPDAVKAIDAMSALASTGDLQYHVLAFRRRGG